MIRPAGASFPGIQRLVMHIMTGVVRDPNEPLSRVDRAYVLVVERGEFEPTTGSVDTQ